MAPEVGDRGAGPLNHGSKLGPGFGKLGSAGKGIARPGGCGGADLEPLAAARRIERFDNRAAHLVGDGDAREAGREIR